jgi:WD40 repeat protein
LLAATDAQRLRLWQVGDPARVQRLGPRSAGVCLAFAPDGKRLAAGDADGSLRLWDVEEEPSLAAAVARAAGRLQAAAFSPDGRTLVTVHSRGALRWWDASALTERRGAGETGVNSPLLFSPDGQRLAYSNFAAPVILELATRQQTLLGGYPSGLRSATFAPDGLTLATGGQDDLVRLWNVATGQEIGAFSASDHGNRALAFAPDAAFLAAGGADGLLRFWHAAPTPGTHP